MTDAEETDGTTRLHGTWNEFGAKRWCAHCEEWARLVEWSEHRVDAFGEQEEANCR